LVARNLPLQVGVGVLVTSFRTEACLRQAWPVRLCQYCLMGA
jgi:hypothetical protein